ncbi:MAG TPA: tetratricopeptide repeat protein [Verrucomicrobiae bacterium]|nr:tetratricopeptide repeat protein [Verrucomicrobiae bacterium]
MNTDSASSKSRLAALVLAAVTVAAFWGVSRNGFLNYDDPDYITSNPIVQRGLTWEGIRWAFTSEHASNWHPVTWLSHMLDCQLFGVRPAAHHVVNVLLHALNTALLFGLLHGMTGALGRSAFVAALFGWHPLHVESVAWVAERKDLLSLLFFVLTLWAYWRYTVRSRWRHYVAALVMFVLGLMSKPMLVTTPFVLLLLDWWPLRRLQPIGSEPGSVLFTAATLKNLGRLIREKVPFFLLALASSVITLLVQRTGHSVVAVEQLPLGSRLINALVAYVAYLARTIWPTKLAVFYPHPGIPPLGQIALAVVVLAGVSALVLRTMRSQPHLFTGWCWYLGTLVPVIGIVQVGIQAMADRYTYLPLIGIGMAVAWAAADLAARYRLAARVIPAAGCAVAAAWVFCTVQQVGRWRDDATLFSHARAVTTNNHVATAIIAWVHSKAGRYELAEQLYQEALDISPDYAEGRTQFGLLLLDRGRVDEAIAQFERALAALPSQPEALYGLGVVLLRKGRPAEAAEQFQRVLRVNPMSADAFAQLAFARQMLGQSSEALSAAQEALRLQPTSASAWLATGNSMLAQRKFGEAISHFRRAVQLEPDSVPALNRLAWLLATHSDASMRHGADALRFATRACQLTANNDPLSLNALAAAYAETGQFDQAVATAQRALDLATASGQTPLAGILQKLVDLYKAKTPYRE